MWGRVWHTGYFLGINHIFLNVCAFWCTASEHKCSWSYCYNAVLWDDVTWNISDIMPWHSHDVIGLAYNRCLTVPLGVHLVLHIQLFTLGTHACLDWCAEMSAFLEPTSYKCIWLDYCYSCDHPWCIDASTDFRNIPWALLLLLKIHLHRTALPSVDTCEHYFCCRRSTSSEVYHCWVNT